jgi:DNA topoisomerase VI subunit A
MNVTLKQAIGEGLKKASNEFTRAKRAAYRKHKEGRVSQWQLDRLEKEDEKLELKAAAYKVIEQCYNLVSDNGKLPANKRQIYYKVRPLVLEATGKEWKDSQSFTQGVLRDFMADNPELTANWDIVADARGHFTEPHVLSQIGIGTLEVRSYVKSWVSKPDLAIQIDAGYPTFGPHNRFKFALFIEKEGFDSILERSNIAQRYDLAIFSSKGQTNVATRQLAEILSEHGVTILVAHDFDIAGFSIAHWLFSSNETYQFEHEPTVIDLGLRLKDVKAMGLQSEPQEHKQQKDPTEKFFEQDGYDVTEEECDFLSGERSYSTGYWIGQRVELNAMTSAQFIQWLEKKLRQAGVKKVVPGKETLATAWKRAVSIRQARELIRTMETEAVATPKDLEKKLRALLKREPHLSWDSALLRIAEKAK